MYNLPGWLSPYLFNSSSTRQFSPITNSVSLVRPVCSCCTIPAVVILDVRDTISAAIDRHARSYAGYENRRGRKPAPSMAASDFDAHVEAHDKCIKGNNRCRYSIIFRREPPCKIAYTNCVFEQQPTIRSSLKRTFHPWWHTPVFFAIFLAPHCWLRPVFFPVLYYLLEAFVDLDPGAFACGWVWRRKSFCVAVVGHHVESRKCLVAIKGRRERTVSRTHIYSYSAFFKWGIRVYHINDVLRSKCLMGNTNVYIQLCFICNVYSQNPGTLEHFFFAYSYFNVFTWISSILNTNSPKVHPNIAEAHE